MKPRLPIAWRIVLGLSVALIVIACAFLGTMFAKGGLAWLTARHLRQLVPPVLGLLTLVLAIICAAVTKRLAGLPLSFRDHDGPSMPTGGINVVEGKPVLQGGSVRHEVK